MELTPQMHAFIWSSPNTNNCNTYLIRTDEKAILVDPGHAHLFDHVRIGLDRLNLDLEAIDLVICTHAHPDHIEAVRLFNDTPALFALHRTEWDLVQKLAPRMGIDIDGFSPNFLLDEGELTVGDVALTVYHTPGHSPGAITLHWPSQGALFTGDLIFKGGLGRTDLPGGNGGQLKESIRRMAGLEAEWLLSGHGEVLSGAAAVRENFIQVEQMWFDYV